MATATAETVQEAAWVDPTTVLQIEGKNPRNTIDPEQFEQLKASIKQHGIFTPLLVRKNGESYELVAGYRRLAAALDLKLDEVPIAVIKEKSDDFQLALAENLQRENFTLADEIRAVRTLLEEPKATHKKIAKLLNRSEPWVSQRAAMGIGSDETMTIIDRGNIPGGHLLEMAKLFGQAPQVYDAMVKALDYMVEQGDRLQPLGSFRPVWFLNHKLRGLMDEIGIELFIRPMESSTDQFVDIDSGDEGVNALLEAGSQIPAWQRDEYGFMWTEDDVNAARAYGGVLEIPTFEREYVDGAWVEQPAEPDVYLLDLEWAQSQLQSKQDVFAKGLKKWEKEQAKASTSTTGSGSKSSAGGTTSEETKEEKAKRLDKERKAAWKVHNANHDVWAQLLANAGTIKVLSPEAVELALNHSINWESLDKALVLLDPQYTIAEDSPKPKFVAKDDVKRGIAEAWVNSPKKQEERLQRAWGLLAAAMIVDSSVIPQARRVSYSCYPVKGATVKKLVEKVFLPAQLKKIRSY